MATGEEYNSLSLLFRVSKSSISKIIKEACTSIIEHLHHTYLRTPNTEHEWKEIARKFGSNRQFKQCTGCIDSKHIRIRKPNLGGSKFFNYKKFHSIHLFALVDSEYNFLYVRVGDQGSLVDANIWSNCEFKKRLDSGLLNYPTDTIDSLPYTFIGDGGFKLSKNLLTLFNRPQSSNNYQKRIYNYRLSRTRRVIENVFGVISQRFRVLSKVMTVSPETAKLVVGAVCVLHNLLNQRNQRKYHLENIVEESETEVSDTESYGTEDEYSEIETEDSDTGSYGTENGCSETENEQVTQEQFVRYFFEKNPIEIQWKMVPY